MLKMQKFFKIILRPTKYNAVVNGILSRSVHEFNFDSDEEVITNILGQVMLIGINLPDTKNLLTETALKKLDNCLNNFDCNDNYSVAILHGCGGNFCTGIVSTSEAISLSQTLINTLQTIKKPVIGALNGYTTDYGLFLAIMCDLRAMEQSALAGLDYKTQEIEILPVIYERLLLSIGLSGTTELICTRHIWSASQCLSSGFVSHLVEHGCAIGRAIAWAQSMAFNSSLRSIIQRKSDVLSYLKLTSKVS